VVGCLLAEPLGSAEPRLKNTDVMSRTLALMVRDCYWLHYALMWL